MLKAIRWAFSRVRYHIRRQPAVGTMAYMAPNFWIALRGGWRARYASPAGSTDVALCLRFRDEGRYLKEWIDYYVLAGVSHFFLYNNNSIDGFAEVLRPYVDSGRVTLIEWPRVPASPDAEHDCIQRALNKFAWVGFLDADEFVVIKDGRRIDEFLREVPERIPGLALHWYYFGSSGHERRPDELVTEAYTKRSPSANAHFKVFVRPERVTRNRNSHNFYFSRAGRAVREDGSPAYGSMANPARGEVAWVNHYYCKSLEDFLEKASRKSTLDKSGITEPSRTLENARRELAKSNEVEDRCALQYRNELAKRQLAAQVKP